MDLRRQIFVLLLPFLLILLTWNVEQAEAMNCSMAEAKYCSRVKGCIQKSENCSNLASITDIHCQDPQTYLCKPKKMCLDRNNFTCGNHSCPRHTKIDYCPRLSNITHGEFANTTCLKNSSSCCGHERFYCKSEHRCVAKNASCALDFGKPNDTNKHDNKSGDGGPGHCSQRDCDMVEKRIDTQCVTPSSYCAMLDEIPDSPEVIEDVVDISVEVQCPDTEEYCLLSGGCVPKGKCNSDEDASAMNLTSIETDTCDAQEKFCPLFMGCIPRNSSCSVKSIIDWMNKGNSSETLENSKFCGKDERFCPLLLKCVDKGFSCDVSCLTELDYKKYENKNDMDINRMFGNISREVQTKLENLANDIKHQYDKYSTGNASRHGNASCSGTRHHNNASCHGNASCANSTRHGNATHGNATHGNASCHHGNSTKPLPRGVFFDRVKKTLKLVPNFNCSMKKVPGRFDNIPVDEMLCARKLLERHRHAAEIAKNFTFDRKVENVLGIGCRKGWKYCASTTRCVKTNEDCAKAAPTSTGKSGKLDALKAHCAIRQFICPRLMLSSMMCEKKCKGENYTAPQRPKVCCPNGTIFCEQTFECLKKEEPCKKDPCPVGQVQCNITKLCANSSEQCCPTKEEVYCVHTKACQSKMVPCQPPRETSLIIRSYINGAKIGDFLPSKISAVDFTGRDNSYGNWQYSSPTGWKNIPASVTDVAKTTRIRFAPKPGFNGASYVNFTTKGGDKGMLYTIVLPKRLLPKMNATWEEYYQIQEDSKGESGFELENVFPMGVTPLNDSYIPDILLPFMDKGELDHFYKMREQAKKDPQLGICITGFEPRDSGVFQIKKPGGQWPKENFKVSARVAVQGETVRFVPVPNYHGNVTVKVRGCELKGKGSNLADYEVADTFKNIFVQMSRQNASKEQSAAMLDIFEEFIEETRKSKKKLTGPDIEVGLDKAISEEKDAKKKLNLEIFKVVLGKSWDAAKEADPSVEVSQAVEVFRDDKDNRELLPFTPETRFTIWVTSVNDPPKALTTLIFLPPIEYNTTVSPNQGSTIKDIVTAKHPKSKKNLFNDDDKGTTLGIGVVAVVNSSLGVWKYKLKGGSWQVINQTGQSQKSVKSPPFWVLFLGQDDSIKFELASQSSLWTNLEALTKTALFFMPWDQSDERASGTWEKFTSFNSMNGSLGLPVVKGVVTRKGCDGRPGSRGQVDRCGKCGGDGMSCLGCDNKVNSGARRNKCKVCTLGTTGKLFNHTIDCAGGCNKSFTDSCGACQRYGKARDFKDCAGTCYGKARKNKCGQCVLGTTGKSINFGEDACGKCGGDNSTCAGCDGVPNSGKVRDLCKACLKPDDASFNTGCSKLKLGGPYFAPANASAVLAFSGAGLSGVSTVTCLFTKGGTTVQASAVSLTGSKKKFSVTAPSVTATGEFTVTCKLDSSSTQKSVDNGTVYFYDQSTFSLTSVTPEEVQVGNNATVTVMGSGFVDTGEISCVDAEKGDSVDAVFINSSAVQCTYPHFAKSRRMKLKLSFQRKGRVSKEGALNFTAYAVAPSPQSAKLHNSLKGIMVTFNKPAKPTTNNCSKHFDAASYALFGSSPKCSFPRPNLMIVIFGRGATLAPNDVLKFSNTYLEQKFQQVTKPSSSQISLTVRQPDILLVPKAKLRGPPPSIGVCQDALFRAGASSGGGGRKMKFSWNITFADSSDSSITASSRSNLTALNNAFNAQGDFTTFVKITYDKFQLNVEYLVYLTVTNFLNQSDTTSLKLVRVNKILPYLTLDSSFKKVKASQNIRFKGKVELPPCLDKNSVDASVVYLWEIDQAGITLSSTDKPWLTIKKGTLVGGKTYELTLTAMMANDQTLSTTAKVKVETESSPVEAKIRGAGYRVYGLNDTIILDGRKSFDPDYSLGTAYYSWECFDEEGFACFFNSKRVVLPQTDKISFRANQYLESNKKYTFKFTFTKDTRSDSKEVTLEILPGSPPAIKLKSKQVTKVDPTRMYPILARVTTTMPTTNITWECVEEDGYGFVDLTEAGALVKPEARTGQILNPARKKVTRTFLLLIAKDKLGAGVSYKVRLTAAHDDATGFSEIEFSTNAPPTAGVVTISPSNGTALDTLFTISAIEGFADDAEDGPLRYVYGFYTVKNGIKKAKTKGSPGEANVFENIQLPQGDKATNGTLTMFIDCMDIHGATTRVEFTAQVQEKVFSLSDVSSFSSSASDAFKSGNLEEALSSGASIVAALKSSSGNVSDEMKDAIKEMQESMTSNTLSSIDSIESEEQKELVRGSMVDLTDGGSEFSDATKTDIASKLKTMESADTGSARRRRRSSATVADGVTAKDATQVESTLATYSNIIVPSDYSSSSMTAKNDYLEVLTQLSLSMCKNLNSGQPAQIAKSTLVVLRSEKNTFTTADTADIELACNDCTSNLPSGSAEVLLGSALKSDYGTWSCTSEDTCNGACIASAQFPDDVYSTEVQNGTRGTDIVSIQLFNPETLATLSTTSLASPAIIKLPVKNATFAQEMAHECRLWDSSKKVWTTAGCTAGEMETSGNVSFATCNCTKLGVHAVYLVPKTAVVANNVTNTTAAPTTAGTPEETIQKITISFSFNVSYDAIITNESVKEAFKASVKSQLVTKLGVKEERISNLTITKGSIVVTFDLLPSSNSSDPTLTSSASTLENLVKSGAMVVSFNGQNITADATSFTKQIVTITATTAPPTQVAVQQEEDDDTYIIVGAVLGSLAFMVIMAVVLYHCCYKKGMKTKVAPEKEENANTRTDSMELGSRTKLVDAEI